jgi:hypothetical protein
MPAFSPVGAKMRIFLCSPHARYIPRGLDGFMTTRIAVVLVAGALLVLGIGGALWATYALRTPEASSVDLIELNEDKVLDERDETDKQRKDRRRPHRDGGTNRDRAQAPSGSRDPVQAPSGGSGDSSGGAHVVQPPPPEEAGDEDDDREGNDDGDD